MSQFSAPKPEDLCRCPCHLEGLECHSCYTVACRAWSFETELKERMARQHGSEREKF